MTANRFNGEVEAPEFGDGFTLRLDMRGQAELESQFGDIDFAWKVRNGLAVLSATYLVPFLKVALRKDGERLKEVPELPTPIAPIATHCLDCLALFHYGKSHQAWVDDMAADRSPGNSKNPTTGTKALPGG
jgi:hypothetical protein